MNTSIEKSEEERKKCTCSLKGGGQGGGQALVGEGRMAAGQGPAAAAGGKAGLPLAAAPGTGGLRGEQGRPTREARPGPRSRQARDRRPPREARPGRRRPRDRRPPRTPQAAGPVARAAPFLPRSAATDRRPDSGGPVEARVVVPWRGVSPLRDAKKMVAAAAWKRMEEKEERERWARVTCWAA